MKVKYVIADFTMYAAPQHDMQEKIYNSCARFTNSFPDVLKRAHDYHSLGLLNRVLNLLINSHNL